MLNVKKLQAIRDLILGVTVNPRGYGDLNSVVYLQQILDAVQDISSTPARTRGNLAEHVYLQKIRNAILGVADGQFGSMPNYVYLQQIINAISGVADGKYPTQNENTLLDQWNALGGGFPTITLPQWLESTPRTTVEDFESAAQWTLVSGAGSIANNAVQFKHGSQSITITTPSGAWQRYQKTGMSFIYPTNAHIWMYCHTNPATTFLEYAFYLATDATFTKYMLCSVAPGGLVAGWNYLDVGRLQFVPNGGAAWTDTYTVLRVAITPKPGQVTQVSLDYLHSDPVGTPACIFNFDDGNASIYTQGFPYMRSKRVSGTLYAISDLIGSAGYLVASQLQDLSANRWIIANHTKDHTDLTTLTQANVTAEVAACKTVLDGLGLAKGSAYLAYPFGAYNATVRAGVIAGGMLTGRLGGNSQLMYLMDMYQLQTNEMTNTTSLATAKGWIDTAKNNGTVAMLLTHKLVVTPSVAGEWGIANFQALVDYAIQQKVIPITIHDLYNLQSGSVKVVKPIGW